LKQARQSNNGMWVKIDEQQCRRAFRHFMKLLNLAVYGNAVKRHGKRLRVLPVLEKGEVRARSISKSQRGTSGRWHYHCGIELPQHIDAVAFEKLIVDCWSKVHWAHSRIVVRGETDEGWIDYMLKPRQKSAFDTWSDCIDFESLHNPIADAQTFFGRFRSTHHDKGVHNSDRLVG
jgi:hypothetical protein